AYMATRSTQTPVLYQRYVGHDNNRDFYALNQLEARNISRVFYRGWCPQVVYNHHQTAPRNTIIYTPPFRDPFNYQIDPLVVRGIEIVSAHMNHRFALEDKPGVISRSGASYSAWWNGGLRSTTYFHNMIGILTESFGRPEPTRITQTLSRRLPYHDYPQPVASQLWHARQTIEYLQTANFAMLDYGARFGDDLLMGMYTMAARAIRRGREDHWTVTPRLVAEAERRDDDSVFSDPAWRDPRAYVLPADQPDWSAATRLARTLWRGGVDLEVADEAFPLNGKVMPAGSLVIRCDQPYRAHVLDMLEPQWHPDDMRDGKPIPPYDAAGWTLSMQMDVRVERTYEALPGPFVALTELPAFARRDLPVAGSHWLIDAQDLHTVTAVNRLLAAGCDVRAREDGRYEVTVTPVAGEVLGAAARDLGVRATASDGERSGARLRPVRVGLFDVFGGHMATGWDRWLLEQFEFPVETVWGERVERGDLREDFDVLVFHTGLPGPRDLDRARRRRNPPDLDKLRAALPPFEDWSDLEARAVRLTGDKSLPAIREFVEQGGTLLALGREVDKVIRHFDLPVKVGTYVQDPDAEGGERRTTRDEYYVPGSLLAIDVDTGHPLARGASPEMAAMLYRTATILAVPEPSPAIDVVAAYRAEQTLLSGWAIGTEHLAGKAGVVEARVGAGRVLLYGIDATYRGQPLGTAKMFFQGILTACERAERR
ncbi:MAG: peptidase, partial [Planctomycetota bacterium]